MLMDQNKQQSQMLAERAVAPGSDEGRTHPGTTLQPGAGRLALPGACPAWCQGAVGQRETQSSNHSRGVLKTVGLLPGAMRGLSFNRRVEALLTERNDLAPVTRPMWRLGGSCASGSGVRQSAASVGEVEPGLPPAYERVRYRSCRCWPT